MKGFKRKGLTLLSGVLLLSMALTACGGNNNSESAATNAPADPAAATPAATEAGGTPDHSKEVKLVGYLLGEAPKGMPEVMAAVNEKLKKDINATLEINYIGWGDVASKYPLILASGQDVDFVFAADWNFYVSESNKGSFLELNEDMIKSNMPKYYANQDPAAYQAAQVNGKQYMIPTTTPDRKVNVIVLRKDIMDQAGLVNPTKISELEPYLAAVKQSHPDMIPLNLDSQYDLPTPFGALASEKFAYPGAPMDSGDPSSVGVFTDNEDPAGKVLSITDEPVQGAFKYAADTMKRWYDAGYINKNPYSNKVRSKDNFVEGKAGIAFGNSIDIQATLAACAQKGIETYVMPVLSPTGHAPTSSWLNNGVAIAANTPNAERALQALDLIMQDESYVYLTYYGIEGKNYAVTADGKLTLPEGVTAETNTYPADAAGFWFVNKDYFKPSVSWTDSYIELNSRIKDFLAPVPYLGFSFNSEKVKSEIANLKNVSSQYFLPITIGAVKDVDKAFATLNDKLKAAGIDKVKAEVEAQTSAFLSAK
ncbi:extracellular solute-binding protein [Paenibacillus sp. MMS20-IR301]|uniref:extracellular solute-binding protein n=1 Tax=Paenibacillus sp. MMS20-IR301 TaxID=2895946 RepID=UPI0028E42104|nr:extracellular solute-binding protein [Paenibacillus sp. MMS20-IR301]WNS44041.1 extracellular solute-binding protein [Paenibacillus sp. MMS20-IR301]